LAISSDNTIQQNISQLGFVSDSAGEIIQCSPKPFGLGSEIKNDSEWRGREGIKGREKRGRIEGSGGKGFPSSYVMPFDRWC